MRAISISMALLLLSGAAGVQAADVSNIMDEAELNAALSQSTVGDTLTLGADIAITGVKAVRAGVTLDGAGYAISGSNLLNQNNRPGAVIRNLTLNATSTAGWTIACRTADVLFENCTFNNARIIAWDAGAQINIVDCTYTMSFPSGSDFNEPLGSFEAGSVLSATNSLFVIDWQVQHVDLGLFKNFGAGGAASVINVNQCTVVGGFDPNASTPGRHLSVFSTSGNSETNVANSVIIADVSAIFRTASTAVATSSYNCNAGMLRPPAYMKGTLPNPPAFYKFSSSNADVLGKTGDFAEFNPFVDALNGDYRLVATSSAATGSSTGGPVGALLGVVDVDENAYNTDLELSLTVTDLVGTRTEEFFHGWQAWRGLNEHYFLQTGGLTGAKAMRLEARDTEADTGGAAHNVFVSASAYQVVSVKPGYFYTVTANARRRTSTGHSWANNGTYGIPQLGLANGMVREPNLVEAAATFNGAENAWQQRSASLITTGNQMTIHLIHKTNGSWNMSDFDDITLVGFPAPDPASVNHFNLYR